ncbi:hypothetical protein [Spirillospora sp. NPDC047279]|uniref:hypothetical protein n=1 Tax=Spirillospora sp. NPDC047279 TaxID=3155478 RepID=UPI003400B883
MNRIITRFLDGRVCAYDGAAEGALDPVIAFAADADEVSGHDVAPDLGRAVYATQHEVVCVDGGGAVWRYDLLPRSTVRYGHHPGCAFSKDGKTVWVYRPDAMAGRGGLDRWVVLDAAGGGVLAEADLGTVGHGGRHHRHPNGTDVLLDVGEGQDGVNLFRGSLRSGLESFRYDWIDRCVLDLAPDGSRFMTADHEQDDVAFHRYPDGEVTLRFRLEEFGVDTEDGFVEWSGGFLTNETAIVTVGGEEEWHRHYRVDLASGGMAPFDAESRDAYDIEPLGDGSWLTTGTDGRPVRRRS